MLDIKVIRSNPDKVKAAMKTRNADMDGVIDELLAIDDKRRELLGQTEKIKAEQNAASKDIPRIKKEGGDVAPIMERMKELAAKAKELGSDYIVMGRAITGAEDRLKAYRRAVSEFA